MSASNAVPTLSRDPVCGMNVNPATAKYSHEHDGKKYYFCCGGCAEKFKGNPQGYLDRPVPKSSGLVMLGMPASVKPAAAGVVRGLTQPSKVAPATYYVCPMCPEVREIKPVPCPSCGMALEPETPVASTSAPVLLRGRTKAGSVVGSKNSPLRTAL